jgi:uncharacterized protein YbjT (DUF2867 family)
MKIIVTGATGMVGEGVMHECLLHPEIEEVLIINRKTSGFTHPKLKEVIHNDFFNLTNVESALTGYDAVLFCLGVSSVGMKEPEYASLTYDLTLNFAKTILKLNPSSSFAYISGAGTDSTENGRMMWARVKGKTENDLSKLGFKSEYNFRPGIIIPTTGLKNTLSAYKWLFWLVPVFKLLAPNSISSLKQLGEAMIKAVTVGYEKNVLEINDIKKLAGS